MKFKSFADPPKKKKKYVKDGYEFLCSSRDERPRAENETIFCGASSSSSSLTSIYFVGGSLSVVFFFSHADSHCGDSSLLAAVADCFQVAF